jgi:hypothetical protein
MKKRVLPLLMLGVITLLGFGCSSPVLKQDIPVSTNPMGAKIYANGQLLGETPGTIPLERTRDHIVTLVKENYRQEDVVVKRVYQQDRVLLRAIGSGVDTGLFFKNASMGVTSGLMSMSSQEKTGEAYVLVPPAVKVNLIPLGGPAAGVPPRVATVVDEGAEGGGSGGSEVAPVDKRALAKDMLKIGAAVGASQVPIEKKWESTSSSSRTYASPDGSTRVQRNSSSSTSVGVGVNPAGLVDLLDTLFR